MKKSEIEELAAVMKGANEQIRESKEKARATFAELKRKDPEFWRPLGFEWH